MGLWIHGETGEWQVTSKTCFVVMENGRVTGVAPVESVAKLTRLYHNSKDNLAVFLMNDGYIIGQEAAIMDVASFRLDKDGKLLVMTAGDDGQELGLQRTKD